MSDKKIRASVSHTCIGAGVCVALAPAHFEFHDGRAHGVEDAADATAIESILAAAELCPAAAITTVTV